MGQDYSWANGTPTKIVWVDASAAIGGTGTADKPYNTIQAAVAKATPGTAIMVKEGEYNENVKIPRTVSGTDGAPIWLISADGPGKAHVTAKDNGLAAISGGGAENVVVDGFHVTGGKNGIQFSQNGFDYTDMIRNIVVRNNVIDGVVQDGVKVNGGNNVLVDNNKIVGGNDESIDFVAIVDGTISNNEVSGNTGTSAAIFAKGGSTNIAILNNYVHDSKADGITVGGWTNPDYAAREGYAGYEAKNVVVEGNRVESVGKRPLGFYGAQDSVAKNNYLQATDKYYTVVHVGTGYPDAPTVSTSSNITITDNFITRDTKTLYVDPSSGAVTFTNNAAASARSAVAAAGTHAVTAMLDLSAVVAPMKDLAKAAADTAVKLVGLDKILTMTWDLSDAGGNPVANGVGTDAADQIRDKGAVLAGGKGDDTYVVGANFAKVIEKAGEGVDTILGSGRYVALVDNVENLILRTDKGAVLVGNAGDNIVAGNAGADYLVGGGGRDLLEGGADNDTFLVSAADPLTQIKDFGAGDVISIAGNPFSTFAQLKAALTQVGKDTVLQLGADRYLVLENVSATGLNAASFDFGEFAKATDVAAATAKVMASEATHLAAGTAGADLVYGIGNSVLDGGAGNDSYVIKAAGDRVLEHAGGGIDQALVYTPGYLMDANVENAKVKVDTGVWITGNGLANTIIGGGGADVLRGGMGNDVLTGGKGADVFAFASGAEGTDTITDFQSGADKLDLRDLSALYGKVAVSMVDSAAGLQVYADHGGVHDLIAVLANVHSTLPSADILL